MISVTCKRIPTTVNKEMHKNEHSHEMTRFRNRIAVWSSLHEPVLIYGSSMERSSNRLCIGSTMSTNSDRVRVFCKDDSNLLYNFMDCTRFPSAKLAIPLAICAMTPLLPDLTIVKSALMPQSSFSIKCNLSFPHKFASAPATIQRVWGSSVWEPYLLTNSTSFLNNLYLVCTISSKIGNNRCSMDLHIRIFRS